MKIILSQPYPLIEGTASKLAMATALGAFVGFFLWAFEPFGIGIAHGKPCDAAPIAIRYGLITFCTCGFMLFVVPKMLPRVFDEQRWTGWHECAFLVTTTLCVGFANWAVASSMDQGRSPMRNLPISLLYTFLLGSIPITLGVLVQQIYLLHQNLQEARSLTTHLHQAHTQEMPADPMPLAAHPARLVLEAENPKDNPTLAPSQLLYAAAADNYVEIWHTDTENAVKRVLLRTTLKRVEENLSDVPDMFRCHRAYLVNLAKVSAVEGNAQGYRLTLANGIGTVPVSRSLNKGIGEKLALARG